jgi:hypothetical protein
VFCAVAQAAVLGAALTHELDLDRPVRKLVGKHPEGVDGPDQEEKQEPGEGDAFSLVRRLAPHFRAAHGADYSRGAPQTWNRTFVTTPVAPVSMLQSGLRLFHDAGARSLEAASHVTSGDPNRLVEGVTGLQVAVRTAQLAAKVVQTAQELDEAALDMFV